MADSKILVDTSIIIDYFRSKDKEKTKFYELISKYDLFISTMTDYELYAGARTKESIAFIGQLLSYAEVVPVDSSVARTAAHIYQTLKRENELIGVSDIFIGATALYHDFTLSTLNQKHFRRIN